MNRQWIFGLLFVTIAIVVLVAVLSAANTPTNSQPPQLFVPNFSPIFPSILGWPKETNGNIAPTFVLSGVNTGFSFPTAISFDSSGNMYVTDSGLGEVLVFSAGASGDVAPLNTIGGGNTQIQSPNGIGLDSAGNIFVSNHTTVTIFDPSATGNVVPARVITGLSAAGQMVVGSAGDFYVVDAGGSPTVLYYGTGASSPTRTLNVLSSPTGLAIDGSGRIYVCNSTTINVYAAGASGSDSAIRSISGSNTLIVGAVGLAVDSSDNLYVSDYDPSPSSLTPQQILVFAPTISGNNAPTRDIAGHNTKLMQGDRPTIMSN